MLLTRAISFAAKAHETMVRKGTDIPYIVHPMEAAAIAATITTDPEVLAAAVLHDVMEDCGVGFDELAGLFSPRVAALVEAESHTPHPDHRGSWLSRKQETIGKLRCACREAKIIALGDKLSNMRAISRDYMREGDEIFVRFNQHDKRMHAWYYRSCTELLRGELEHTGAWQELHALVESVYEGVDAWTEEEIDACAV